ncbi:ATP-binding cassette domain-containing protein [Oerskovia rustica]|uniref:ATP-binding cassette domain-containing protein n=1 Tax=Oerskovia rustica TaxID=2762237 RepID=A0ABR8RNM1_9CELL|nr:ATP-binding cassette domain-containing protein [Oerskovia rustica]MBD7949356.1 ATP-binding cassette domain-containing protein [Oerskovia rustica]
MITFAHATKRYGPTTALDDLTVTVRPGSVTGLLGPNGAGKSTALRLALGLDRATAGDVTVHGIPYRALRHPLRTVGAHVDARAFHPGRSARAHLTALARYNRIPARRVDDVLGLVGLSDVAGKRAGGFSLGMAQRLGLAGALLGDPEVVLLDEPVNGLDTDGVLWLRGLLRDLADQGRTVLLSSHLLSELEVTADHVVVLGRGRLLADLPIADLVGRDAPVVVRTPDAPAPLADALVEIGHHPQVDGHGLTVDGVDVTLVGDLAHALGLRVHHLAPAPVTLEARYLDLVADDVQYRARPEERIA